MFKYIGRFLLIIGLVGIFLIAYFLFGGQARFTQDIASIAVLATTFFVVLGQFIIQNAQSPSQKNTVVTEIFTHNDKRDRP